MSENIEVPQHGVEAPVVAPIRYGATGSTAAMKRSWDDRDDSGYQARIKYEGGTIGLRLLDKSFLDEVAAWEVELQKMSAVAQSMGKAIADDITLPVDSADRMGEAAMQAAMVAKQEQDKAVAAYFVSFQRRIVAQSIMGWEKLPIPFSSDALEHLPVEIVTELAPAILEKSQLGAKDAAFLSRS